MEILKPEDQIMGNIQYLAKDNLHDTEKPYYLYLEYDHEIARTNTKPDHRLVSIHNCRNLVVSPHQMFSELGFTLLQLNSPLRYEEYSDPQKVADLMYPRYINLVQSLFPDAVRVEVLEHAIRRRDPLWQRDTRDRHEFKASQPSDYVHIDLSASSAAKCSMKGLSIDPDKYRKFVVVNLWKSINGPVHDFPLTLCDRRTVDHESQTTTMDIVTEHYVNENTRLYYSDKHQWFYWDALQEDEVIVFLQSDSEAKDRAGVPHTAFSDPRMGDNVRLRESIEARVFAYFN